jgi:hypothetical protein
MAVIELMVDLTQTKGPGKTGAFGLSKSEPDQRE